MDTTHVETGPTNSTAVSLLSLRLLSALRVPPAGLVTRALDLRLRASWVRLPAFALSANNLGQVVHTRASVIMQYNSVPVKGL